MNIGARLFCLEEMSPKWNLSNISWASGCDQLRFYRYDILTSKYIVLSDDTSGTPTTSLPQHLYRNNFDDADWFLRVGADTFVVVGNLRGLLSKYDSDSPLLIGQNRTDALLAETPNEFQPVRGTFLLSREFLRRLNEDPTAKQICMKNMDLAKADESKLTECFVAAGIRTVIPVDEMTRTQIYQMYPRKDSLEGNEI